MKDPREFYDRQYAQMEGDETKVLDHAAYRFLLPFAKTRTDVACQMLGEMRFGNVADLGCGACEMAVRKLENFEHYTGYDISFYQTSQTPEAIRNHPKITIQYLNLDQPLPCPDHSFDLVLTLSVIEYVFDPIAFIREISRILKPGGTLLIQTENIAFLIRRLQLLFGQLPTYNSASGWQGGYLHHFTYPTLKKLLQRESFSIEAMQCSGLAPSCRRLWPNLLAADMFFLCRKK